MQLRMYILAVGIYAMTLSGAAVAEGAIQPAARPDRISFDHAERAIHELEPEARIRSCRRLSLQIIRCEAALYMLLEEENQNGEGWHVVARSPLPILAIVGPYGVRWHQIPHFARRGEVVVSAALGTAR